MTPIEKAENAPNSRIDRIQTTLARSRFGEELWRSPGDKDTAAHWSTAVVYDGYLYGCYGRGREIHGGVRHAT